MTIKLRNSSSSRLLSSSTEHEPNVESKFGPSDKSRRPSSEDKEETLSSLEIRLPSSRDRNMADISIDKSTASAPNVVEPDQPSSLSPMLGGAHCEGLKRHHSRNSSSSSQDNNNDDCESVTSTNSLGTQSLNSRKPKRQHSMSVRFADPLITKVFTRPKTLPEEKYVLHYSFEEMDEFREDYYRFCEEQEEQMLLDELANSSSSDDSSLLDGYPTDCSVLSDTSSDVDAHLIDDDAEEDGSGKNGGSSKPSSCKHSISKVLVIHNDVTIVCPTIKKPINAKSHDGEDSNQECKQTPLVYTATNDDDDYSFDNPAFWNGSLTWY
jgi:hypothetical protein